MRETNTQETTMAEAVDATQAGEAPTVAERLADINDALLCDVLPAVWALQAMSCDVWRDRQQADGMRHAINWIAERLGVEVSRIAEARR